MSLSNRIIIISFASLPSCGVYGYFRHVQRRNFTSHVVWMSLHSAVKVSRFHHNLESSGNAGDVSRFFSCGFICGRKFELFHKSNLNYYLKRLESLESELARSNPKQHRVSSLFCPHHTVPYRQEINYWNKVNLTLAGLSCVMTLVK